MAIQTTSEPLQILVLHNQWANNEFLKVLATLSEDQLEQEFEIGMGSLKKSMIHIIGAMRGWSDLLGGREQRPRLENHDFASIHEIIQTHDEVAEEFAALAIKHPVSELVSGERGGRSYTFNRGSVVTHVTTHGMHHRAQMLNMLRRLNIEPLPPSAVVEWTMMTSDPK